MASSDPLIREIERRAQSEHPRDQEERFKFRNKLRQAAGLPPEKRVRGGLGGVYDRNKHLVAPIAALAVGVAAPALLPALKFTGLAPSTPTPNGMLPQASFLPSFANATSGDSQMTVPLLPVLIAGARATAKTTLAGAATTIATGLISRFLPPPAPGFGPQGGIPQPKEGIIGRTISRILPGGMTGREWTPATDLTDKIGRPLAVHPATRESVVGPPGYVVVTYNGTQVAMLRSVAIRAGLYNPPPKPPVSGWDMRAINRAASATKRVKKLAGKVGLVTHKRGSMRAIAAAFGGKKK